MGSTKPYQSRVLTFVSHQAQRVIDRSRRVGCWVRETTSWGIQILIYPFVVIMQALQWAGRQLVQTTVQIQSLLATGSAGAIVKMVAPESQSAGDRAIQKTLPQILGVLSDQQTGLLQTKARVRGLASDRATQSLVLVSDQNDILDVLTVAQQVVLKQYLADLVTTSEPRSRWPQSLVGWVRLPGQILSKIAMLRLPRLPLFGQERLGDELERKAHEIQSRSAQASDPTPSPSPTPDPAAASFPGSPRSLLKAFESGLDQLDDLLRIASLNFQHPSVTEIMVQSDDPIALPPATDPNIESNNANKQDPALIETEATFISYEHPPLQKGLAWLDEKVTRIEAVIEQIGSWIKGILTTMWEAIWSVLKFIFPEF